MSHSGDHDEKEDSKYDLYYFLLLAMAVVYLLGKTSIRNYLLGEIV